MYIYIFDLCDLSISQRSFGYSFVHKVYYE